MLPRDVNAPSSTPSHEIIVCDAPARLDRLPWSRFRTLVVAALGITWILDGLEVTLAGAVSGALQESPTLRFSATDIGLVGGAYLAGAVLGALFFGWLTDRLGRRRLFFMTLAVYIVATIAIAVFYAIGTGLGGIAAPVAFGMLIETGSRDNVFIGYAFGASLMIAAAIVQGIWGVAAERRSLEDVARPLTAVD